MKWLRPGYDVRLGGDIAELSRHSNITHPNGHVFIDDLKSAWEFKQAHPDIEIAHRWEKLEEQIPKEITPEKWLADRLADFDALGIPHDAIVIYDTNEPDITPELVRWWETYAPLLLAAPGKPKALMCNFGTGRPKQEEIPLLHNLLALMVANPDRLYLGLDEYAPVVWTAGINGSAPPGFNVRNQRTDALEYPIQRDKWFTEIFNNACWFMGRWRFWAEYCHQQFKKLPNIWIAESGFDDIKDVEWWQQGLPQIAKDIRLAGWRTLLRAWQMFWPQWTPEEALWLQTLRYIEVGYESNFVAADGTIYLSPVSILTLFGWSPMKWENFDYSLAANFKKYYETYVAGMPIVTTKPLTLTVAKPTDARNPKTEQVTFAAPLRNLRSGPATGYPDAGDILSGDVITHYKPTRIAANGSQWQWIESAKGNGWLCIDSVEFSEPPAPAPVQEQVEQPAPEAPTTSAEPPPPPQENPFKVYSYQLTIKVIADNEEAADTVAKYLAVTCGTEYQQLKHQAAVLAVLEHVQSADFQVEFNLALGGNES